MTPLGKGDGFGSSLHGNTRGRKRAAATRALPLPHQPSHLDFCILPFVCPPLDHPFPLLCPPGVGTAAAPVLPGRGGPAEGPCGRAGRLQTLPGVAIASAHTASSARGSVLPPSLPPAASAAEHELGRWQSVSETLQSQQKQLHAVSVSLTDQAPPWCV